MIEFATYHDYEGADGVLAAVIYADGALTSGAEQDGKLLTKLLAFETEIMTYELGIDTELGKNDGIVREANAGLTFDGDGVGTLTGLTGTFTDGAAQFDT